MTKIIRKMEAKGWMVEANKYSFAIMVRWGCQPIRVWINGKVEIA